MSELKEIINVPPKRRITIPEGYIAVIMPKQQADDVTAMCFLTRKGRRLSAEERTAMHDIAGDLLLAVLEARDGQGNDHHHSGRL